MLMRYNGATNNMEFRGRAADVESTAHMTINRDSGALVVSPATATGDASVQLPSNAIGAAEIEDEPGADAGVGGFLEIPEDGTITLCSVTMNFPGPGIVLVRGIGQFNTCNEIFDRTVDFAVVDSASGSAAVGFSVTVRAGCGNNEVGVDEQLYTVAGAGSKTFYLRASCLSAGARAIRSKITAVYYSTQY